MILKERAGVLWNDIIAEPNREIKSAQILKDLEKRKNGKPLSKIYKQKEFYGLTFKTNEHTLDPRPDSETLIDVVLDHYKDKIPPKTILDLGTGTGCLILTLLKNFPDAVATAVDISKDALSIAEENAKTHNLDDRITFIQSNWSEKIDESFDLVISNPPYIASNVIPNLDKEVKNYDPILALDGGFDGMQAYELIFSDLFSLLNDDGFAVFEIGFDQVSQIERLSKKYKIRINALHRDLAGNPRVVDILKSYVSGDK